MLTCQLITNVLIMTLRTIVFLRDKVIVISSIFGGKINLLADIYWMLLQVYPLFDQHSLSGFFRM